MVDYNFSEHGFVILRKVFPESVLAPIRELTSEIISNGGLGLEDTCRRFYLSHRTDQGALHDLYQKKRFPKETSEVQDSLPVKLPRKVAYRLNQV